MFYNTELILAASPEESERVRTSQNLAVLIESVRKTEVERVRTSQNESDVMSQENRQFVCVLQYRIDLCSFSRGVRTSQNLAILIESVGKRRLGESARVWASSSERHTGRRDLLLSECNVRKCMVATFVVSEDTCCFEYADNSLRFGWEAVDAQGCEPDDKAACRTILWPGGLEVAAPGPQTSTLHPRTRL